MSNSDITHYVCKYENGKLTMIPKHKTTSNTPSPKQIMDQIIADFDQNVKANTAKCLSCVNGVMKYTFNNKEESMSCFVCNGKGTFDLTNPDQLKRYRINYIDHHIMCDHETEDANYVEDNECDGCISKHHYHCNICGKITQIG
jgi:hypothetical protein